MAKVWITTEDKEEDITWQFTVKNGVVISIGPVGPVDMEKIKRTDAEGQPFLRIPMPKKGMIKAIEKKICELCGEGVSGEGTYSDENQRMEFDPEMQS
jgi:hypothetical protein